MVMKFRLENIYSISDFRSSLNEASTAAKDNPVLVLKNSKPQYIFVDYKVFQDMHALAQEFKKLGLDKIINSKKNTI